MVCWGKLQRPNGTTWANAASHILPWLGYLPHKAQWGIVLKTANIMQCHLQHFWKGFDTTCNYWLLHLPIAKGFVLMNKTPVCVGHYNNNIRINHA